MGELEDRTFIAEVLQKHKELPFVKRILERSKYPVLKEGLYDVSHKMAWAEVGDNFVVFPTVAMEEDKLTDLQKAGINPLERALRKGNFISFGSAEEADWFSKNYKKYWAE